MTQEEILQYNKRCAEFLGAEIQDVLERIYIDKMKDDELLFHNISVTLQTYEWNGTTNIHYIPFDMLQFHSDWNWIMEVIEAIEKLKTETSTFEFHTQPKSVLIKEERNYCFEKGDGGRTSQPLKLNGSVWITGKTKKEAVVEAINQFLIWYEQNKTT